MPDVLPDSRLTHNPTLGSVMVDWLMPDGTTVRVEVVPIHCANCGCDGGYVPLANTTFAFWLCQPCFETHGPPPGTVVSSDEAFRQKVAAEMQDRFGRPLSSEELGLKHEAGDLGRPLELLLRESPWKG